VLRALLQHARSHAEVLEDVAAEALLKEVPRAERFATAITVAAAVAPLLGLLGTVTGMIATFDIITEFGTGDPRKLSGGISEALITTQLGLVVAIPALLLGNLLNAWANGIMGRTERAALALLNSLVAEDAEPLTAELVQERASA
jgi:biopolymer transport protein ExbB